MADVVVVEKSFMVTRWWVHLIRGILAIIFGIIAISWPSITLEILVILFGVYAIVAGFIALVISIFGRGDRWWILLIEGLIGIAIGIIVFSWPIATVQFIMVLVALWAILMGVFELIAALKLREILPDDWLLALIGILSILFGVVVFIWMGAALMFLILLFGFYALFMGVMLTVLSFRLRTLQNK